MDRRSFLRTTATMALSTTVPDPVSVTVDRVVATLTYRRRDFTLALQADNRTWCTVKQT